MSVLQMAIPNPPPDRGRLLTPEEVAELYQRSSAWVRRRVPHKMRLGHKTVRWFEKDILEDLNRQRPADKRET